MNVINGLRGMIGAAIVVASFAASVRAEDSYYVARVADLVSTDAARAIDRWAAAGPYWSRTVGATDPYVVLDGPGEAYVTWPLPWRHDSAEDEALLVIRAPAAEPAQGRLVLPDVDRDQLVMESFTIQPDGADAKHRERFHRTKLAHYQDLLDRGIPGAAWFRHQARLARQALGEKSEEEPQAPADATMWAPPTEMERTFGLISGGRAMSESLQLDRVLPATRGDVPTVDIDSIEGITVREFDWTDMVDEPWPELDPLAAAVPADQHALLFPTFHALIDCFDTATEHGTPILRTMEPRAEHAAVRARYETQLCLPLDTLARELGPRLIESVVLTGADPYLRTGADVAVIFQAKDPMILRTALAASAARIGQAHPDAELVQGQIGELAYTGLRSPDRRVCSYRAALSDTTIAVTNSLAQLQRLDRVRRGAGPSLASLPEFAFFRSRYPRGAAEESALLVVSDQTIRRWCGPRWRIGTSRRARSAALLAEIQASHFDRLAAGEVQAGPVHTELPMAEGDELTLTPGGPVSAVYGTLGFQTPILELDLDEVTQKEADVYAVWRDRYQYRWRDYFDPIAIQFQAGADRAGFDMTVMPLISGTEYGDLIEITRGAKIAPDAGDAHAGTIAHASMAINYRAPMAQMYSGLARAMAPEARIDPLGWLGESISVYAEPGPFWEELAGAKDEWFPDFPWHRLPVALHAEVSSGMKLTAFLAALRAYVDQTAPGMTIWENRTHGEIPYVRITPSEMAQADENLPEQIAVHYAASGEALLVSLDEEVLKRAIDRQRERRSAKREDRTIPRSGPAWLGESLCVQMTPDGLVGFNRLGLGGERFQDQMQASAWGNIPILNQWRRRHPDRDPVELHERFWHRRLVCPGGGEYRWNEQWQTMESTVFGRPGAPKQGPTLPVGLRRMKSLNSGLTFEEHGLRARVQLERTAPSP